MTKKPVKRTTKPKPKPKQPARRQPQPQKPTQQQTQNVIVNVPNPTRRAPVRRSQSQQQPARAPQIIPIPYPIIQPQLTAPPLPRQPQPQAQAIRAQAPAPVPVPIAEQIPTPTPTPTPITIPIYIPPENVKPSNFDNNGWVPNLEKPNPVFENHFKDLNKKIDDISENFNTYGKAFWNKLNKPQPAPAPDVTIKMDIPDTPEPSVRVPNQTPIVRGVKDLIDRGGTVYRDGEPSTNFKIDENDNVIPLANPKTLFRSPTLNMNPNQFNKPKVLTYNSDVFNRPTLAFNPPAEEFAKEEEKADEEAVEEAVVKPKPLTKKQIEERRRRAINDELRTLEGPLKDVEEELKDNPNKLKAVQDKNKLDEEMINKEIDKRNIQFEDYDRIMNKLREGNEITQEEKEYLNQLLIASRVYKDTKILNRDKDPVKILNKMDNSAVDKLVKRKQRQLNQQTQGPKPTEPRRSRIASILDLTQNTEGVMSNPKTYEI